MKVQIVKYLNPKGKVVEMRKDNFKGRDLPENIIEEYEVEIKGEDSNETGLNELCIFKYKIRDVTKLLFERYLNQFELSEDLERLSYKAIEEIENYPIDKLSRWLGFIQAYVIFTNQTTIDIERDFSRPLLHNAYENENIKVPSSFSSSYKFKGEQMRLNKKNNIPFLSVWKHKDGGLYKALKVIQASPSVSNKNISNKIDLVWYLKIRDFDEILDWENKGIENIFIRMVEHFKSSFTFVDFREEK